MVASRCRILRCSLEEAGTFHEGRFKWSHAEPYPLSVFVEAKYDHRDDVRKKGIRPTIDAEIREPTA
jgi:hypothetical protein